MRKIGIALSVLALVGCNTNQSNETESNPSTVLDALAAGDAKACVDPQVTDVIYDGALEGTNHLKLIHEKNIHLSLDNASMSGRNTDIKEVSCTASLPASSAIIEYTIRPEASGNGIIVNWKFPTTSAFNASAVMLRVAEDRLKEEGLTHEQIIGVEPKPEAQAEETPKPANNSDAISWDDPRVSKYQKLEETCRGSYDEKEVERTCPLRDAELVILHQQGLCLGKNDQPNAEFYWHKCGPESIQEQP